jgi:hypothetical protein
VASAAAEKRALSKAAAMSGASIPRTGSRPGQAVGIARGLGAVAKASALVAARKGTAAAGAVHKLTPAHLLAR